MKTQVEEQIIHTEYSEIMQKSYIDYAMSVIVSRALPDIRDGLKPVQRRTLYDMHELGIRYDRPYRKCARIVGDTMGKYHPHGDSSIYESLVVMAQDFKKGLTLVDGHGNFGSIEGDGAAAMRYTEARLEKVTQEEFLRDLDKNVVNFLPNFDETEKEPEVLPVRLPNFLVNGSDGIAVGMVTSTPPHNLGEVIDAEIAMIQEDELSTKDLMKYIQGPDFPTGGLVVNQDELEEIYETGVGKLKLRGKVTVEKGKNGKDSLVITEIPYTMIGANIGKFLNDVASLIESRKITDITDISNQSSKEGIRIVLELRKGADTDSLINLLYKKTRLEDTFGVNMLAVVNGRPETLSLKKVLEHHIDFQFELNNRKYRTLLDKELQKKEIQEGLIKAVDVIDLIIEILRGSRTQKQVKDCLVHGITDDIKFKNRSSKKQASELHFTEAQAEAILEMRLAKLIGLELQTLLEDHAQTLKNIASYEDVLNNYDSMAKLIIRELKNIRKEYAVSRKTTIENAEEIVLEEKKPEAMEVVFLMDRFGYAKTVDLSVYEKNKEAADSENRYVFSVMNTDKICIFTDQGNVHQLRVSDLPYGKFREKGKPVDNLCNYDSSKERIVFAEALTKISTSILLFCTADGMVKQTEGVEFDVAKRSTAATKLQEGDTVLDVTCMGEAETMVFVTDNGICLRIPIGEIPMKKKAAIGVRGIRLAEKDHVKAVYYPKSGQDNTMIYQEKEVHLDRLKIAGRDTKGSKIRV